MTTDASRSEPASSPVGDSLRKEIFELFFVLFGKLRDHYAGTAAAFGLTPQQAKTIRLVGDPRSMREIADVLQCDASYVTGIADKLEDSGLIERRPSPADRRVKQLALTPKGRRLRAALEEKLFSAVPGLEGMSGEQREVLYGALRAMFDAC
ncbi:MarR family transcriptional regulator [Streptomyces coacervatus]|uniref:MarR family winged helix-turn-helix transcriptional regulator n=1 Tax=Streptomyces coacervatus TaxID=647381 RepID=UPI0023DB8D45|nr:MarR family transcriptional regulator [Streptomyces coacervatus]MDF2267188.1 MarR family transcriptional regulator [Streptomyces coacervatus]